MSPKTLIIFLDFDGVMHPHPCFDANMFTQLPLIEEVLREFPSAEIVISSSWRLDSSFQELKRLLSTDIGQRVIGTTPFYHDPKLDHLQNRPTGYVRQWEIERWMSENSSIEAQWVAVDDYPEWFEPNCPNLLVTSAATGFVENDKQTLRDLIMARLS
ncbi:MAG: HAD domain-containing protein [Rhodoferax sp.]|uniref:HAD domain-containing protein n=1 Tax=Rhodoferax sp. TaxID=50421 RepID=UPI0026047817|nr:HAD domain-containing protein [Rhodoferax sp.]MDD2882497.1 HAD domain-containing protein [Rhodoferax sp.]